MCWSIDRVQLFPHIDPLLQELSSSLPIKQVEEQDRDREQGESESVNVSFALYVADHSSRAAVDDPAAMLGDIIPTATHQALKQAQDLVQEPARHFVVSTAAIRTVVLALRLQHESARQRLSQSDSESPRRCILLCSSVSLLILCRLASERWHFRCSA
jgi:hypothetical protein